MSQHANEFLINLKMLGFDPHIHFKNAPHLVLDENIFLHGANNSKAFEIVSRYLFRCLDKKRTLYEFKECWPVTDRYKSRRFAQIAYRWLEELRTQDNVLKYVPIRKSHLEACHGPTMDKLMLAFSTVVLSNAALNKIGKGIPAIHLLKTTELHQRVRMLEARFIELERSKQRYLEKQRLVGKQLVSELDKSAIVTAKNKMLFAFKNSLTVLKDQLITESHYTEQQACSRNDEYRIIGEDVHSLDKIEINSDTPVANDKSIPSKITMRLNNTTTGDTNANYANTSPNLSTNNRANNNGLDASAGSLLPMNPTYVLPQSHVLRHELVAILDRKQGTLTSLLTLPPLKPQSTFDYVGVLKEMMEHEKVLCAPTCQVASNTVNADSPTASPSHDKDVDCSPENSATVTPYRSPKRSREDDYVQAEPLKKIATSSPIRGIQQQETRYLGLETPYMYSEDEDIPVLNNERPPWKSLGDIYDIDLMTPMRHN